LWGNDYNVAAETPHVTLKIIELMSKIVSPKISKIIKWHPETDYLGNHMLSAEKFRKASGWMPKISLSEGIRRVYHSISKDDGSYDPLIHLNAAKKKGVDLTDFYNSNI
jgi:nucleoside-diphosphate-sugar epimerase